MTVCLLGTIKGGSFREICNESIAITPTVCYEAAKLGEYGSRFSYFPFKVLFFVLTFSATHLSKNKYISACLMGMSIEEVSHA